MIFKTNIEICEMPEDDVAGRTKIKMTGLKVADNPDDNNGNGINWVNEYVKDNLDSLIGAAYKVTFIDDDKTIPSGHGDMQYDDDGNVIFPDSDSVGSIQKAYIDSLQINDSVENVLVTEGYLYNQSYPNFVQWLKDESNSGTVYGSIEINGKGKSKKIIYANGGTNADGTPKIGRQPKIFDFVALAILSDFVPPADESSQVLELNSKQKEGDTENMANENKSKITIDNSKDSANMSDKWSVDKGAYFKKCIEASNAKSILNEGYLIVNMPSPITDITEADCKYPHHSFNGDMMVVDKAGIQAACQRLSQNDASNDKAKAHLKKHYNELGLELPEFLGGKKVETNTKVVKPKQSIEVNELCSDDILTIVTKTFNAIMAASDNDDNDYDCCYNYYPYKLYPQSGTVIMQDYSEIPTEYYQTTYSIQNNIVTLGDIIQVESTWTPITDEPEAEINASFINKLQNSNEKQTKQNKEVNSKMEKDTILELNEKIENKTNEINALNTKNTELNAKNTELNEAVVNANKSCEELNAKVASLTEELNACKTENEALKKEKADAETEKKKAEVNSYFETEIPKNGFADEEVNSLKSYVDANDLDGLKSAEAEICAKKFKEMISKKADDTSTDVETNAKHSFIPTAEPKKKDIPEADGLHSFFD